MARVPVVIDVLGSGNPNVMWVCLMAERYVFIVWGARQREARWEANEHRMLSVRGNGVVILNVVQNLSNCRLPWCLGRVLGHCQGSLEQCYPFPG